MRKLIHYLAFYTAFILPALYSLALYQGGWWFWAIPIFALIVLPAADWLVGVNGKTYTVKELIPLSWYRRIPRIWTLIQSILLLLTFEYILHARVDGPTEWIGMAVSLGVMNGGIGLTLAHEMLHKDDAWDQVCAHILLAQVGYLQFAYHHIYIHHVWLGTSKDAVSAPKGMSLYRFLPRAIFLGFKQAWTHSAQRRKGKAVLHPGNFMVWPLIVNLLLLGVLVTTTLWLNASALPIILFVFIFQALHAIILIETVDYMEHYGLRRTETNGRPERVKYEHSWNTGHLVTNFFLFQLQRHPDHHGDWKKDYPLLESRQEAPQLPSGYPGMLFLAFVPPLWFRVVNKRLEEFQSLTQTDIEGHHYDEA